MILKTQISKKEYVKLLYGLTYKKPMILFLLCVAGAILLWVIGYYTHLLPVPKPTVYQYLTLVIITVIQPFTIYKTILKNYNTSSHLKESLEIECTPECIKVRGESFCTEFTWAKMYKVVELKNWFVVYQNNLSANLIPKKSFLPHQADEFKQMLTSIPELRCKLKK